MSKQACSIARGTTRAKAALNVGNCILQEKKAPGRQNQHEMWGDVSGKKTLRQASVRHEETYWSREHGMRQGK
ncbi:MAG: hypothetical protein FRX49_13375, partial [Trebouxia sp. A1-2]